MLPFSMLDTHFNDRVHSRALCQINKSIVKLGNNKTRAQNIKKLCQKWDLNPRPHTRTRILIYAIYQIARLTLSLAP